MKNNVHKSETNFCELFQCESTGIVPRPPIYSVEVNDDSAKLYQTESILLKLINYYFSNGYTDYITNSYYNLVL